MKLVIHFKYILIFILLNNLSINLADIFTIQQYSCTNCPSNCVLNPSQALNCDFTVNPTNCSVCTQTNGNFGTFLHYGNYTISQFIHFCNTQTTCALNSPCGLPPFRHQGTSTGQFPTPTIICGSFQNSWQQCFSGILFNYTINSNFFCPSTQQSNSLVNPSNSQIIPSNSKIKSSNGIISFSNNENKICIFGHPINTIERICRQIGGLPIYSNNQICCENVGQLNKFTFIDYESNCNIQNLNPDIKLFCNKLGGSLFCKNIIKQQHFSKWICKK